MGVERAVVRWYAQRQLLLEELAVLDAKIAQETESPLTKEEQTRLTEQRAETQKRLRLLGPCPTPMMG